MNTYLSLAPLASVADSAMRIMCIKHGARHVTTEMISAAAVYYKDKKTFTLAEIRPAEQPCAIQLFGHEPEKLAYAASALYDAAAVKPDSFDFNMGCPVKKIVTNGEGSALMKEPELARRLITALVKASDVPVTVKFRAGYDTQNKNAVEIARIAEGCGAAAVCVHGRTRADMYTAGTVDYDIIKQVKLNVKIPVIANGDIFSGEDAVRVLEYTGADGIAVARGALGNPFIFEEILSALENKPYTPPNDIQRLNAAREQLDLLCAFKPEKTAATEARKHLAWYTKGIVGAAEIRRQFNSAENTAELYKILDSVIEGTKNQ